MDGSTVATLLILCTVGGICAAIANSKGRSGVGWFFIGFFFGLIGIIVIACLSNLKEERAHRRHMESSNRRLREQLQQERVKSQAFQQHTLGRLDMHDNQLGLDTRAPTNQIGFEADPTDFLGQLEHDSGGVAMTPMADGGPPSRAAPSGQAWYYEQHGQTVGPVSQADMLAAFRSGGLNPSTLVWTEKLGDWTPADQVKGLL
jgi:hypothetical protein